MTRRVSHSEQGRLQGANSSLTALAGIFGPGIFSQLFSTFIGPAAPAQVPGAPFLAAASMLVASLAVGWYVTRPR